MSKNKTRSGGPSVKRDSGSTIPTRKKRGRKRGRLRLLTLAGSTPVFGDEVEEIELAMGDESLPKAKVYDSGEFNVPATDGKGNKERRWVELQPGYVNQIGAILASKCFPYRSEQSFIRHAIHRHIRYLLTLEPQIRNHVAILESINRIISTQEMMLEVADLIGRLDRNVNDLTRRGLRNEAVRMVFDVRKRVESMDSDIDGAWRAKLLSDIHDRFGHLLVAGERVSLVPREEEG